MGMVMKPIAAWLIAGTMLTALGGCTASGPVNSPAPGNQSVESRGEAGLVADALRALPSDPARAAATAASITPERARDALPPGTEILPSEGTWAPDGTGRGGTMTIQVTTPGSEPTSYVAVMVREGDTWKVLATVEIEEQVTRRPVCR